MSDVVMAGYDTVDAQWAHDNPDDAFYWAHNMYYVPAEAKISCRPRKMDGFWVYYLMDHKESIAYVGQSECLCDRLRTHMAQRYGVDVECVYATKCDSVAQMDLIESTLITGFNPAWNTSLTQFADGTSKEEASRLFDSLDWQLVWGFGTMFWSTKRVLTQIKREVMGCDLDGIYGELMGSGVLGSKKFIADGFSKLSDEQLGRLLVHNSLRWAPSLRFLYDEKVYSEMIGDIVTAFRCDVNEWAA